MAEYPQYFSFGDAFDGDTLGERWQTSGAGATSVTGGVLRQLVGGDEHALAALDFGGVRQLAVVTVSPTFAAPPVDGRVSAGFLFAGAVEALNLGWQIVRDPAPAGHALKLFVGGVETYSEAHDGSTTTLAITRLSQAVVLFGVVNDDDGFTEKTRVTDWTETGAGFSLLTTATGATASGSANFDSFFTSLDDVHVREIDSNLCGIHLAAKVRVYGDGFAEGATAIFYGPAGAQACTVEIVSSGEAKVVAPVQTQAGEAYVEFRPWAYGPPFIIDNLYISAVGYRLLKAAEAPGRYTNDPTNPRSVVIAAIGRQLEIIAWSRRAFVGHELFPETAAALLPRHERQYGIEPNPFDLLAVRRARVEAARRVEPRISKSYLDGIVAAVLPGVEITENEDFDTYGGAAWQFQVYESEPRALDATTWRTLEAILQAASPGWSVATIGHNGFVVGASPLGRDFL